MKACGMMDTDVFKNYTGGIIRSYANTTKTNHVINILGW